MPATGDDTLLPVTLSPIYHKKVTAAFDGGTISSDGGILLLAGADKRLGLIARLAAQFPDHRNSAQITHPMADILSERIFAIACGYPDGNDLDTLRRDPAFRMACGRLPDSGIDQASQPTISRLENTPDARAMIRMHTQWSIYDAKGTRPPQRPSSPISMTPPIPCMVINNCRFSTPITTSRAFCRSIYTTRTQVIAW